MEPNIPTQSAIPRLLHHRSEELNFGGRQKGSNGKEERKEGRGGIGAAYAWVGWEAIIGQGDSPLSAIKQIARALYY